MRKVLFVLTMTPILMTAQALQHKAVYYRPHTSAIWPQLGDPNARSYALSTLDQNFNIITNQLHAEWYGNGSYP